MLSEVNFRVSEKSEIEMMTDRLAGFQLFVQILGSFHSLWLVVETCGPVELLCALAIFNRTKHFGMAHFIHIYGWIYMTVYNI